MRSGDLQRTVLSCVLFASIPWSANVAPGIGPTRVAEERGVQFPYPEPFRKASVSHDVVDSDREMLRAYERDLRDGTRVAVVSGERVIFMTRSALRGSLQRHVMLSIVAECRDTGDYTLLRQLADADLVNSMVAELEREVIAESNAHLPRLRQQIQLLDRADQSIHREMLIYYPGSDELGEPMSLSGGKLLVLEELERIRVAGNWSADHHFQLGRLISAAETEAVLDAAATLMRAYASCYSKRNADRALIVEAARAGRYPTPGDRIRELDRVGAEFARCLDRAIAAFQAARGGR